MKFLRMPQDVIVKLRMPQFLRMPQDVMEQAAQPGGEFGPPHDLHRVPEHSIVSYENPLDREEDSSS
jgi:hypothetical protein